MAPGRKTGGRNFLPGNTAAKGRPSVPHDLKELRKTQLEAFLRRGFEFGSMDQAKLKQVLNDPTSPALDLTLASCFARAISGSLPHQRELWDRLFGTQAPALLEVMATEMAALNAQRPLQNANTQQLVAVMALLQKKENQVDGSTDIKQVGVIQQ